MPYTLHVLGPECKFQKEKFILLFMYNKKTTNERHNVMDIENYSKKTDSTRTLNLEQCPLLIIAEQRVLRPMNLLE